MQVIAVILGAIMVLIAWYLVLQLPMQSPLKLWVLIPVMMRWTWYNIIFPTVLWSYYQCRMLSNVNDVKF